MDNDEDSEFPVPPKDISKQISELPCSVHYILLYPRDDMLMGQYKDLFKNNMKPYLLKFEDDERTTCRDLIRKYIQETNMNVKEENIYLWEYRTTYLFNPDSTLDYLKWNFEENTIDGFCFKVSISNTLIKLQASMQQMIELESKLRTDRNITFYIKENNCYFYVKSDPNDNFKTFCSKIINQIKENYKVTVKVQNLKLTSMIDKQQYQVKAQNFKKLTNRSYVYVSFKEKMALPFQQYKNENNFIIIQDITNNNKKSKFAYSYLKMMRVDTILDKLLGFKDRGHKSKEYGLRIHDLVWKPSEVLSDQQKIQNLFYIECKSVKNVLAFVVTESFIFYNHLEYMGDLYSQSNKHKINKLFVQNQPQIGKCEYIANEKSKKIPIKALQKEKMIKPIAHYTSNLSIKIGKGTQLLYQSLNIFLRSIQFGYTHQKQYEKWQFLLTRALIKSLKYIESYKGEVLYRGVGSYYETAGQGKIIKFKQFNSCSSDRDVAQGFGGRGTIYTIKKPKMGKSIQNFSCYQQSEVLMLPYSQYRVVQNKKDLEKDVVNVTIEQVSAPQLNIDLDDQPLLFVVWMDGDADFSRKVRDIRQSTFFVHLNSKKELQDWLKTNRTKFDDETISTVLITNMAREENGVKNQSAGVDIIKVYKAKQPQGKVMLSSPNTDSAKEKLQKGQISLNSITIGSTENALRQFFSTECGIQ